MELVRLDYMDSVGMFASLGNRLMLGRSMPTPKQIAIWDNVHGPALAGRRPGPRLTVGKSVLGVWRRRGMGPMPTSVDGGPRARDEILILIPVYNDWDALTKLLACDRPRPGRARPPRRRPGRRRRLDPQVADRLPGRPAGERSAIESWNSGGTSAISGRSPSAWHTSRTRTAPRPSSSWTATARTTRPTSRGCSSGREAEGWTKIVFAERAKRSESLAFRVFYGLYKLVHRVLTGQGVRVGNFSVIPRARLASLVVVSEMWNHYAAAAFASRQPYRPGPDPPRQAARRQVVDELHPPGRSRPRAPSRSTASW